MQLLKTFVLLFVGTFLLQGQIIQKPEDLFPVNGTWAKNTLQKMTLDEKIGQLFMIPAYTGLQNSNLKTVEEAIKKYKIGGIIFMQGHPVRQAEHANYFQKISEVPLLISQDAEWGLSMRLDSCIRFPKNITLAAIEDDSLLYEYGRELAMQLRAVGVHINFAPVVDINNNPNNPVIGYRSFGENKHNVTQKALMMMQGMQKNGVIATAKHFPGHGDTDTDSHLDLPILKHDFQRLDTLELYPFKHMIDYGVMGVMVAHLFIPALDPTPNLPSTLSPKIVQKFLKDSLNFQGLVFTDALNMGAVTKYFPNGDIELKAFLAGNDILLFADNLPNAISKIKNAIQNKIISEKELDERVFKILLAKEWLHLNHEKLVDIKQVTKILHSRSAELLVSKLYKKSITLVKNEARVLPIKELSKKFAYLQLGNYNGEPIFLKTLRIYAKIDEIKIQPEPNEALIENYLEILKNYDYIIVGIYKTNEKRQNSQNLSQNTLNFLNQIQKLSKPKRIVAVFGSPYILHQLEEQEAIVIAYEEAKECQQGVAEVIFAGLVPEGKLPIYIPKFSKRPLYLNTIQRLQFAQPEEVGMDYYTLSKIDTALHHYIKHRAFPGASVLVIRGNKIVYAKSIGKAEYHKNSKELDPLYTIYDVASITKIAATTLCVMHLYEQQAINLYAPLGRYLTELKDYPVGKIRLVDILTHTSGLPPYENFWTATLKNGKSDPEMVSNTPKEGFTIPLTDKIWIHQRFDSIFWDRIKKVKISKKNDLVYSDLGMILLGKMIEKISGYRLDEYCKIHFYEPLGMYNTFFQPYKQALDTNYVIPPTEIDSYWRRQKIQGYVHDPNAAMMGGVAGHAGLFSNIYDLGKLGFMLKNGGEYGGTCFLDAPTIKYFTTQTKSKYRRGLGFDKPEPNKNKINPVCSQASLDTYGHLGFTGTALWIDPQYDLVYVFLSNRTYPNTKNPLFNNESVRSQIMSLLYRAIDNFKIQKPS